MSERSTRIMAELRPHPLAFAHLYAMWLYVIIVSLAVYIKEDAVKSYAAGLPLIGSIFSGYAGLAFWAVLILVPMIIVSIVKISWRYALVGLAITVIIPLLLRYFRGSASPECYYAAVAIGLLGMASVEVHRRAHRFYVTDRGIIIEYRGLKSVRRELLYSRITDIVMEKGLLGRMFGFGNIIPVTASGLGLGEDSSGAAVGVGASRGVAGGMAVMGGRGVNVPRTRSFYMLYAVPNPEKVYDIIVEAMRSAEEAPYLKKILETLEKKK